MIARLGEVLLQRPYRLIRSDRPLVQAFWSNKVTVVAAAWLVLLSLVTVVGFWYTPHDTTKVVLANRHLAPLSFTGSGVYWLGTDALGRDLLSRLISGGRISVVVAIAGVTGPAVVGTLLGLIAGYHRGPIDDLIMRVVDFMMAMPGLLLLLVLLYILGPSFTNIIIVFTIDGWVLYCRVVRGLVLSLREQPFIEAAHTIGAGNWRIMLRHILPNTFAHLLTIATLGLAGVILTEASLSFLGMGVQPPQSSWGLMVSQGRQYIDTAWWEVAFSGLTIFFTALSANIFGLWLRAVNDPLQRWRWMSIPSARGA
ncbi:MAG: ABC transporter permease [Chloroflexi bacterium]|nr:ABC transporter permease [Chloroflexota bacterium]